MEDDTLFWAEMKPGRRILGRLPHNRDLSASIGTLCRNAAIYTAVFSLAGAVAAVTVGAYDPAQQVYVTFKEPGPLEVVTCVGNVSNKDGHPIVHAQILLSDARGKLVGGRLFSETPLIYGEIDLQELTGPPLTRVYDPQTGLGLWERVEGS
jgi:predicted DNA-binding protein with PD1-like motif